MNLSVLELCKTLITKKSLTPHDDNCQLLISELLKPFGFSITHYDKENVKNLWAVHGEAHTSPLLVFAGHTDVVPTGPVDKWITSPFTPLEKNGMLYGRGAADMKGSLAAMIIAATRFIKKNPQHKGRLGFLITSDEEGEAIHGTQYVIETLQNQAEKITYCLVGEPSSEKQLGDQIRIGRRGSLNALLRIHGKQGHIAYPELANNPIHTFAPALNALIEEKWDNGNTIFPPTSFQCSNISSGTGAGNVIPGELTLQCNFRYCPVSTPQDLQQRFETILKNHNLHFSIDWQISAKPFYNTSENLQQTVIEAIEKITGLIPRTSSSGGTSDGRFIAQTGAEVIELGLINETIHQINEAIPIKDLEILCEIYEKIISDLLSIKLG
jgi:succinyl-diaminopimelate desuccinylase